MKLRALMLSGLVALFVILLFLPSPKKSASSLKSAAGGAAQAGERLTRANIQILQQVIGQYIATEGESPASLGALRSAGLMITGVNDAWGRAFRYQKLPGTSFRLTSAGKDGRFDTADDIVSDY